MALNDKVVWQSSEVMFRFCCHLFWKVDPGVILTIRYGLKFQKYNFTVNSIQSYEFHVPFSGFTAVKPLSGLKKLFNPTFHTNMQQPEESSDVQLKWETHHFVWLLKNCDHATWAPRATPEKCSPHCVKCLREPHSEGRSHVSNLYCFMSCGPCGRHADSCHTTF